MSRRQSRYCVVSISDSTCADALTTRDKAAGKFPTQANLSGSTQSALHHTRQVAAHRGLQQLSDCQTWKARAMARARRGC